MKIKLEAVLDIDSGIVMVKPNGQPWDDFGYFLEILGYLAKLNLGHDERVKTTEEMAEYIKQYMLKAIADYKDKTDEIQGN